MTAGPSRGLRLVAPVALGLLVLAGWQAACVAWQVPVYLVPSPWLIAQTL